MASDLIQVHSERVFISEMQTIIKEVMDSRIMDNHLRQRENRTTNDHALISDLLNTKKRRLEAIRDFVFFVSRDFVDEELRSSLIDMNIQLLASIMFRSY